MLSLRLRVAVVRFTLLRRDTARLLRFDRCWAIWPPFRRASLASDRPASTSRGPGRHASQSFSFSLAGRYVSVMNEIPRRDSASSSYFTPDLIISWISCCHCFAWNHG